MSIEAHLIPGGMWPSAYWPWAAANLFTGLAYLGIPYEMWRWSSRADLGGAFWINVLFIAFIVSCGFHHLRMPWTAHGLHVTHWDVIVDLAMMIASVTTHMVLVQHRHQIADALAGIFGKPHQPKEPL